MICPATSAECDNPGCRRGGCQGRVPTSSVARINSDEDIARELYGVALEHMLHREGRPIVINAEVALAFERLPHDERRMWVRIARHARPTFG